MDSLNDLLVYTRIKNSALTSYHDCNQYATKCTHFTVLMKKHSNRNSSTWLLLESLKNVVPPSGFNLASLLQIDGQVRQISDLLPK